MVLALPLWVVAAKLLGLYDRDEEHVDHSTVDEVVGVFQLVTLGAWAFFVASWLAGLASPHVPRLIVFWLLAIVFVTSARGLARTIARRSPLYLQNTIIVGAGDIGQLAARKLLQHPEYGINLVGFVDAHPRPRRPELEHLALRRAGRPPDRDHLGARHRTCDHRVFGRRPRGAAPNDPRAAEARRADRRRAAPVRDRRSEGRHPHVRGSRPVGLPPSRLSPSSRLLKRSLDCVVAFAMIVLLAPLMASIAVAVRLDSSGPVLFRQRRLGRDMRPFTVLKFRTMRVDTDQDEHRRYIATTLTHDASPNANGLYKLDRSNSVTSVGRFLRKTSLDELPQLFNVLARRHVARRSATVPRLRDRGLRRAHHFERFLMPPGLTGLWQVTARARSTFGEALDMDVEYVRGWSFSLDLRLLLKTPFSSSACERPHDAVTVPGRSRARPARIGVVGLGYWGPNLIRNLNELEEADLRWICDLDQSRLDTFVRRYPTVRGTRSFEDLIADPELDAVAIATPVSTHYPLALAALEAGKHVFIEKPLAASVAQAEELAAVAAERGLTLMPGHTFLYSPPVNTIRDLISSGELGDIYFISMSRVNLGLHQSDVSVAWDLGPHDFSILRYWLEATPSHVSATSRSCIFPNIPDVAFINLEYEQGAIAHVELSWLAPSKLRRTTIVGSRKMVVYDDVSNEPVRIFDSGVMVEDPQSFGEFQLSYRTGDDRVSRDASARAPAAGDGGLLPFDPHRRGAAVVGPARRRGRPDDRGGRRITRRARRACRAAVAGRGSRGLSTFGRPGAPASRRF